MAKGIINVREDSETEGLEEALKDIAKEQKRSFANLVRYALSKFVKENKDKGETSND